MFGRRNLAWGVIAMTILMVLAGGWVVAETGGELCIPLGTITPALPEGVKATRTVAAFPHGLHFGYACNTCHHTWTGDEHLVGCATSGCHDAVELPEKAVVDGQPTTAALMVYKNAYHELCIGCHKDIKKKNRKAEFANRMLTDELPRTGPTSCLQCHPRY